MLQDSNLRRKAYLLKLCSQLFTPRRSWGLVSLNDFLIRIDLSKQVHDKKKRVANRKYKRLSEKARETKKNATDAVSSTTLRPKILEE